MGRAQEPGLAGGGEQAAERGHGFEVDLGDAAARRPVHQALALGAVVRGHGAPQEEHLQGLAAGRPRGHRLGRDGQEPDRSHDRGRVDRLAAVLVVERDVAGDDGRPERLAGLRHPGDGLPQHVRGRGPLGVPEVEAVRHGHGLGPRAGHVDGRLGHGLAAAATGIEGHPRAVAVEGYGHAAIAGGSGG